MREPLCASALSMRPSPCTPSGKSMAFCAIAPANALISGGILSRHAFIHLFG